MIITKHQIPYEKDLRDGSEKTGYVKIQVLTYTRDIIEKVYRIDVLDTVDNTPIKRKVLTKTYQEIDGLRAYLKSQKTYTSSGSILEDELLADAVLLITIQDGTYNTQPTDWELYVAPPVVEPVIENPI